MTDRHHHPGPGPEFIAFTSESALRLRMWLGGKLHDEIWLDANHPESGDLAAKCATYHVRMTELAEAAGVPWLVEVYDPAAPADEAYLRFGTDSAGMVAPAPMPPGGLQT